MTNSVAVLSGAFLEKPHIKDFSRVEKTPWISNRKRQTLEGNCLKKVEGFKLPTPAVRNVFFTTVLDHFRCSFAIAPPPLKKTICHKMMGASISDDETFGLWLKPGL